MKQVVIENPVLNSPFREPTRINTRRSGQPVIFEEKRIDNSMIIAKIEKIAQKETPLHQSSGVKPAMLSLALLYDNTLKRMRTKVK